MAAMTGEGEAKGLDVDRTINDMAKRHSDLLALSSFGIAYPEIADLIRGLQRQVSAQQGLIKGLHGRIHALESQNARYGNDGR